MRKIPHNVELDPELKMSLVDLSKKTGRPQNSLIREAIRQYLEKIGYPGEPILKGATK